MMFRMRNHASIESSYDHTSNCCKFMIQTHHDIETGVISGTAMGTTYRVTVVPRSSQGMGRLQRIIRCRLADLDNIFSIFNPASEISRFNRLPPGNPFPLSPDLYHLITRAKKIHQLTEGAWDATIKPLVDIWGFGNLPGNKDIPNDSAVDTALEETGFHRLIYNTSPDGLPLLISPEDKIQLDLGGIAKGYGVDALAEILVQEGVNHFLVEIGGEIIARGCNPGGKPWTVGVAQPDNCKQNQELFCSINLNNLAVATSGTCQNFFHQSEESYSHLIDPANGRPISNRLLSATVTAPECTLADSLATAFMIIGPEKSLEIADRLDRIECLLLLKCDRGLRSFESVGFQTLLYSDY